MPNESKGLDRYQVEAEEIYKTLRDKEAYYKKEKPFYLRSRSWDSFTHRNIHRLNELRELSASLKRSNLPTDGAVYLHVHTNACTTDESGACGNYQGKNTPL